MLGRQEKTDFMYLGEIKMVKIVEQLVQVLNVSVVIDTRITSLIMLRIGRFIAELLNANAKCMIMSQSVR